MYNQIREDTLFLMFYASVAMLALIACCYLLFRRSNSIAPDVIPPARLHRWTAAFFAAIALCHLWYLPTYFLTSPDEVMLGYLIAGWLDCMTVIPLMIVILLTMLQDYRRPLWPVCVMMVPLVVGLAWCIISRSDDLLLVLFVYFLLMCFGLIIYMVRAIRQYGRWKRDETYASAEENLGGRVFNMEVKDFEKVPNAADAQIDLKRGVVITTTKAVAPEGASSPFGSASFHENDYPLYYYNIKENAATRVAAYLGE